jgi:hypothetical protein
MVLLLTSGNIFSLSSRMLKQWEIERYKNFLIRSSPVPTFATGFDWYSQGIILRPGRLNSIVEVKRIQGSIFNSKEDEEQWLDASRTPFANAKSLLKPYPDELMDAHDVSPIVNSAKYDGPECIHPVLDDDKPHAAQLSLL